MKPDDSTVRTAPDSVSPTRITSPTFLAGGGEMGELIRAYDWSTTPLGRPEHWPQSLKTAIRIMLTSRQPIWIGWGDDLLFFYNDPYKSIIGGRHPVALGQPTEVVWREIWSEIAPRLDTALSGSEGTFDEQKLLIMERNGYPEETYFTFSYSPIPDDSGGTGGIICANSDDTARVVGERQLLLLRELAASTANRRTEREAFEMSMRALRANPHDLPFALLYVAEPGSDTVSLAGTCGIEPNHPAAPRTMHADRDAPWPFADVLRHDDMTMVGDLAHRFGPRLPTGAWTLAPRQAAILPLQPSGETGRAGVLIVGLNPCRLFDDDYRAFLHLVAGQIGAAIGYAHAYEEERQRAEALAEIDRAKTTFFSNISHEFRTPLTLMLGPLEELLAKPDDRTDSRQLLEITHRNGLRLLKLVNALLDFSRIEAGRVQVDLAPTDIAVATAELASLFRSAIEGAGLTFVVECAPLPRFTRIDRDMWEKIVLNLLSNAFKFTLSGTITVSVRMAGDERVEVCVSDTGIGIPADELPRLFERFHRVAGAAGRSIEGSGIGLALVQELVTLLGGTIRVDSEPGRGSCFTIGLPADVPHLPAEKAAPTIAHDMRRHAQAYVDSAVRAGSTGGNAVQDDAAGALSVADGTAAKPAPDGTVPRVLVAVTDTGSGMTPEVREHVFEPFFTTKPEGQGTGLGLSMVYGFVKQSGGHVKIYSEPGHGTTIRLYLPRERQQEDLEIDVDAGPMKGGTETILVAEDDEDVRFTVVEMLSDLGYRVLKARDAQSALAIVESGVPIDLLLTDVVMPGPLRSTELARQTRERLPDVAVLFTSGYTDNAIVHSGRLDEGIELLSKPYTHETLARKVRHVLRSRDAQTPSLMQTGPSGIQRFGVPARDPVVAEAIARLRILFVEDDELVRASTVELLRTYGLTVVDAANERDAQQVLAEQPVDVLMTDVGLAGASGVDLAIDACARRPGLHVIFVSGYDLVLTPEQRQVLTRAVQLRKPYAPLDLVNALAVAVAS